MSDAGTSIDALIAAVPYYRYLGLRAGPAGTVVLPADPRNIGDHTRGVLHGGVLAGFLEAAAVLYLRASGASAATTIASSPAKASISNPPLSPSPLLPCQRKIIGYGRFES